MTGRYRKNSDGIFDISAGRMTADRWRVRERILKIITFLLILAAIGGVIALDRAGIFGTASCGDFEKYDNKKFCVMRVIDGDTLDVDCIDGEYLLTRIRLWGVDTPETVKPNCPVEHFGMEASGFTRRNTLNKMVRLELVQTSTRDKYGRLLAYVYLPDGRMLNRELVAAGYAYADPRFQHPRKSEFIRLADDARKNGAGLWSQPHKADWPYYVKGSLRK
ncbi:MAG TPA: thermonuclease family protein [Phycisphaerae bacterium]|nr:thermonuclease family protein [Phycisphaerae bacterium]HPS52956.1 thermonuclease family protein [Phycisphaerae bacterium]